MVVQDLGLMGYREAWAYQEAVHARVVEGEEERVLLVEHPPVITFGRRVRAEHLVAAGEELGRMGVEVVESDRGGDVTFHGPGQLVAYPILRLNDHRLSVGGYVRRLQETVVGFLRSEYAIKAVLDPNAVGVWAPGPAGELAKVCALGVRIRRGVSLHGIALNVTTDLRYFDLIVPCGLRERGVTSLAALMPGSVPPMSAVKAVLGRHLLHALGGGDAPPSSPCA